MKPTQDIAKIRLLPLELSCNCIERPRLMAYLDDILAHRLVIVHCAAGYGKTSLLTQWFSALQASEVRVTWLALEEEEANAPVFFAHLTEACDTSVSSEQPDPAWRQGLEKGTSIMPFVSAFANSLAENPQQQVIFLDDYHLAQSPDTDALMRTLIRLLPRHVHLVVSSRWRPGFEIENLRVRGDLLELTVSQIQFRADEVLALLDKNCIPLDSVQLHRLTDRTEGWPIALQMVSLLLDGNPKEADLISGFSGKTTDLTRYLSEQVFSRLSEEHQAFLLHTSILSCFNGDVANALMKIHNGWQIIDVLHEMNLFLTPDNSDRQWFRYHTLFREFLTEKLRREAPDTISTLHIKAAEWFATHSHFSWAIRHALEANETAFVADLLNRMTGWRLVLSGQLDILRLGLGPLPDDLIRQYPALALGRVFFLIKEGAIPSARRYFDSLDISHTAVWTSQALAERNVMEHILNGYEDIPVSIEFIEQTEKLRKQIPQDDYLVHAMLLDPIAAGYYDLGLLKESLSAADQAIENYRKLDSFYGEVFVRFIQSNVFFCQGNLKDCEILLRRTREEGLEHPEFNTDLLAHSGIYLSAILYEFDQLEDVATLLEEYLPTIEQSDGWFDLYITAYEVACSMAWRREGMDAVIRLLENLQNLKNAQCLGRLVTFSEITMARYLCRSGSPAAADKLRPRLEAFLHETALLGPHLRALLIRIVAVLAEIHIMNGRADTALEILRPHIAALEKGGHIRRLILLKLAMAQAFLVQGDEGMAVRIFDEAIYSGLFNGFKRVYIDNCQEMLPLINAILQNNLGLPEDRYRDNFLKELRRALKREARVLERRGCLISSAETRVLEELDRGYSNKEIARTLEISPNTVKYRLKNLFQKLEVSTRNDLVRVYREQLKAEERLEKI